MKHLKAERIYPRARVTKKAEASLLRGHPWVYEDEVEEISGTVENGCLVDVISSKGRYLGTALLSEKSKIRLRLLSTNANDRFDTDFFRRRVRYAWEYRKAVMGDDRSCCRLIFGEADHFPGLTVDRYGSILVTQTLSVGMEKLKPVIFPLLTEVLLEDGETIDGIYERNDVAIRQLEGLEENKGWYPLPGCNVPDSTSTEIVENGVRYEVDFENGQKTGFFLDQKYNRRAVAKLSQGRRVLDCFTHTGTFALNAALGGAEQVTGIDISRSALETARHNAGLNGLSDRVQFEEADVFDLLPSLAEQGSHPYDLVILDPPAFTKSRKTIRGAERGYKEINYRAMKLLPRGGYLATASCSHFMTSENFIRILQSAASDAQVELRQVEARQQAPDHPILWNVPETDYLKFFIFQVI